MTKEIALKLTDLHKTYAGGVQALKGIDLSICRGDFFALLGPNGAGKTTAIGIMTSIVNKTAGSVEIFGTDLQAHPSIAKKHLGVVPQELNIHPFENVTQVMLNQASYYGMSRRRAKSRASR